MKLIGFKEHVKIADIEYDREEIFDIEKVVGYTIETQPNGKKEINIFLENSRVVTCEDLKFIDLFEKTIMDLCQNYTLIWEEQYK